MIDTTIIKMQKYTKNITVTRSCAILEPWRTTHNNISHISNDVISVQNSVFLCHAISMIYICKYWVELSPSCFRSVQQKQEGVSQKIQDIAAEAQLIAQEEELKFLEQNPSECYLIPTYCNIFGCLLGLW